MRYMSDFFDSPINEHTLSLIDEMPLSHRILAKSVCPVFIFKNRAVLVCNKSITTIYSGKHINSAAQPPLPSFQPLTEVLTKAIQDDVYTLDLRGKTQVP